MRARDPYSVPVQSAARRPHSHRSEAAPTESLRSEFLGYGRSPKHLAPNKTFGLSGFCPNRHSPGLEIDCCGQMEDGQMNKAQLREALAVVSKELAQAKKQLIKKEETTESRKRGATEISTPIENELKAMLECPVCFETMVNHIFAPNCKQTIFVLLCSTFVPPLADLGSC
jgi:hypothetical protein